MKHQLAFLLASFIALVPCAAQSASAMSSSTVGAGPHGYDFLVGTWTCKNSMPGPMSGPALSTVVISRVGSGTLSFHATGTGLDAMGYVVYTPKTKTWSNPSATSTGGYGTESTTQTGKKSTWTGPAADASGKTTQTRDTYVWMNATTYTDLFQAEEGGTWKTAGNSTCTKS